MSCQLYPEPNVSSGLLYAIDQVGRTGSQVRVHELFIAECHGGITVNQVKMLNTIGLPSPIAPR